MIRRIALALLLCLLSPAVVAAQAPQEVAGMVTMFTFTWGAVAGATAYEVEVSKDDGQTWNVQAVESACDMTIMPPMCRAQVMATEGDNCFRAAVITPSGRGVDETLRLCRKLTPTIRTIGTTDK